MGIIIGAYFRTTRVRIAALLYFLIAGMLTQIPLFNYLGYEFSAVLTIPVALISGIITIQFIREHKTKPLTKRTWLFVIGDYLLVNFLLVLIPLFVIMLNAVIVKNCAFMTGMAYYLLLPVVTMVFSVSLALVVGTVVRRTKTVFVCIVGLILSQIILITYTQPQLFAYNLILGYFPGITYDETVGDLTQLTIYRQYTVIVSLLFIMLFSLFIECWNTDRPVRQNIFHCVYSGRLSRVMMICIVIAVGTITAVNIFSSAIGFEHSESEIQKELGRRSESEHFIFYYDSRDFPIREMQRLKAESEYHRDIVSRRLKSTMPGAKKIDVYLYPSSAVKQRLIGTSNTNIAKPWRREIHLTSSNYDDSFRHELVHIMAAEFGLPVIRASARMGMNEGLAVAVDWEPGLFSPHHYAAALQRENALTDVSALFSLTGFASRSGTYAYAVTGSFCKYLIDRFGIERFTVAFRNGAFVRAFSEPLESLINDWKAYLRTIDASDIPPETVRAYFFHEPIFYRICAREVAEKNKRAAALIRSKEYEAAYALFAESYADAPSALAMRGMLQSLIANRRSAEAVDLFECVPENSLIRDNPSVMILHGDALYASGALEQAARRYRSLMELKMSDSFIEAPAIRLQHLREGVDKHDFHDLYYAGNDDSVKIGIAGKLTAQKTNSVSLSFLLGAYLNRTSDSRRALEHFQHVIARSQCRELIYYATMRMAQIEYQNGRAEEAKALYWNAVNTAPTSAAIEYLNERIAICDAVSLME
jgi:tetratricopeptide (TPR) repeat protein